MTIVFIILISISGAAAFSTLIVSLVQYGVSDRRPVLGYTRSVKAVTRAEKASEPLAIEAPRKPIPAAIQAEIDQTPEWWNSLFHNALVASGAEFQTDPEFEPEYIDVRSADGTIMLEEFYPGPKWLEDCSCYACVRAKGTFAHQRGGLGKVGHLFEKATPEEQLQKRFLEFIERRQRRINPPSPWEQQSWEPLENPAPAHSWCG
jgi:hypothetical protein